jgi:hypothetical protein
LTSFTFPNEGLQYLNDAYRNVTISHTKYMILMIKNIFTYLQYIQKYIYTIHIYIDLSIRPWTLGHHDQMLKHNFTRTDKWGGGFNTTLTKNLRNLVWEKTG